MAEDLFHPDLEQRYQATRSFCRSGRKLNCEWPKGCWGAANGWLMLVCPSPGKDPMMEGKPKEVLRPKQRVYYGLNEGKITFGPEVRNTRWNTFTKSLMRGKENYAYALTSVANLDWWFHRREREIPDQDLRKGCPFVWNVIQKSKPRIVVATTNRVWDTFSPHIKQFACPDVVFPNSLTRLPIVFQIPGYSARSVFLKSPQHPSWPFKSSYYTLLDKAVRSFLQKVR
jgi:hypothetical protein